MVSDRERAKNAVTSRQIRDPELDAALANATSLQLELNIEANRHAERLNLLNLGVLGRFFGDGKSLPSITAFTVLIFACLAAAFCWIIAASAQSDLQQAEFWAKQVERSLSFAGVALGYFFGKGKL